MTAREGFYCARCGEWHDELPNAFGWEAPAYWEPGLEDDEESVLGEEQCIVRGEHFFVRGRIRLPVEASDDGFELGVWVSLSEANFERMSALWTTEGRESEPPYFGWLATEVPGYPSTLELRTHVHTRPVGERPLVELEPTEHPLAVEQRQGISAERARELAAYFLHATPTA